MAQNARLFGSARVIALCTVASRITGLARDVTLNHIYGQRWVQDAFNYGFLIPNLFRRLFGEGALAAVFVPVFTEVLDQRGRPAAWTLLGRVAGLMAVALTVMAVLLELLVLVVWRISPGGAMRELALGLTAVMTPFMIGVCLLALFSSILNCLHHFAVPALLPIVLNVMTIVGAIWIGPAVGVALERQVYGVAIGVLAASVLQLAIILPVLRRFGVRFRISFDLRDPDIRRILRIFLPVLLGQGVLLLNVYFDTQICTLLTRGPGEPPTRTLFGVEFAYPLTEGALSAVNNAQRLYQFPMGVLAISLATAALPMFSLYAARGDFDGLRTSTGDALRLAIYEGLPSGLVMIVLAEPIVSLLFEHGRFGPAETARAAAVLRWYGLGMAAFCGQHIVTRAFYSMKDTLTPMWISCGLVALNIALNVTLIWQPAVREQVFGISTSITSTLHVAISLWFLRRRMAGRIGARRIVWSVTCTLAAGVIAAAAAWALLGWLQALDLLRHGEFVARAVRVFAPLIVAVVLYLAVTRLFGMDEVRWVLKRAARPERDGDTPADGAGPL